jgi:UDP-glucose 4-epimerase
MKVILFGANGYIGQNLLHFLLEKNVIVECYDIQDSLDKKFNNLNIKYKKLDISNIDYNCEINWDVDVVYFFSGITGTEDSIVKPAIFISINELGLVNVLQNIVKTEFRPLFIFPSTRLLYKGSENELNEESEKEFKTIYSINKYSSENILNIYSQYYQIKYTIFRICVPYGSFFDSEYSYGTIGFMMKQSKVGNIKIYGNGQQKRTFTHINYILEILYNVLNINILNEIFNIGGETFSISEIANIIANKYNARVEHLNWPPKQLLLESGNTIFNGNKLNAILKLDYKYNFTEWVNNLKNN